MALRARCLSYLIYTFGQLDLWIFHKMRFLTFCTNNITAFWTFLLGHIDLRVFQFYVISSIRLFGFYVISTFELFGPILIWLWTIRSMSLWSLDFSNLCYFDFLTFGHFAKVNFVLWTFLTNVILDFRYFRSMSLRPSDLSDLCHFDLRILVLCYVDL